ncbi:MULTISPECIES: hypothetical protein [Lysinibacillus]|nr:hypothetical protein [Lysinibacillus sphaericus]
MHCLSVAKAKRQLQLRQGEIDNMYERIEVNVLSLLRKYIGV